MSALVVTAQAWRREGRGRRREWRQRCSKAQRTESWGRGLHGCIDSWGKACSCNTCSSGQDGDPCKRERLGQHHCSPKADSPLVPSQQHLPLQAVRLQTTSTRRYVPPHPAQPSWSSPPPTADQQDFRHFVEIRRGVGRARAAGVALEEECRGHRRVEQIMVTRILAVS